MHYVPMRLMSLRPLLAVLLALSFAACDAVTLLADVQYLPLDSKTQKCPSAPEVTLALVGVSDGREVRSLLPAMEPTPELEVLDVPLLVVVYRNGYPGIYTGGVPPMGPNVGGGVEAPVQVPAWDVCVERADGISIGGIPQPVYFDVPQAGSPIREQ